MFKFYGVVITTSLGIRKLKTKIIQVLILINL